MYFAVNILQLTTLHEFCSLHDCVLQNIGLLCPSETLVTTNTPYLVYKAGSLKKEERQMKHNAADSKVIFAQTMPF